MELNIDDNKCTLLIIKNIDPQLINELNINMCINIKSFETLINSNVGIASAITSYARIHMIPYKINPNTLYTDTDSIFTTEALPNDLIGKELGLMKDELNGSIIKEILVLGCKQYGYHYILSNNNIIEKSVWAGVTRDSLTFQELKTLFKGRINTIR